MSLVSEALRKARGEAARESQRRGVVVVPVHVHSFGRGRPRRWFVPGVALAAALAGAGIAWWTLRSRATTTAAPVPPHAVALVPARNAGAPPAPTVITSAIARPEIVKEVANSAPVVQRPAPMPPQESAPVVAPPRTDASATSIATRPPETTFQLPDRAAAPAPTVSRPATGGAVERERSFVVDADLGYAKLHLDWLVYRPGSPFGRINGQDVVEGGVVEGFTVEEIRAEYVKLRDARGAVVLRAH